MGFNPHHIPIVKQHIAGNGSHGRLFFLPGSDGRAKRMGERFADLEVVKSDRQHNVYLGRIEADDMTIDVGAISSGMGCPSIDIISTELILLGAKRFIRVGTAGSLQPTVIRVGDLVLASGGVRNESTSDRYIFKSYPAISDPDMLAALERAAFNLSLEKNTFKGIVHTKDSLYGMEFLHGPQHAENHEYMERLHRMGVLATEMESSHMFILSDVHSRSVVPLSRQYDETDIVKSGAVLAVIGDDSPFASKADVERTEAAAIDLSIEAALEFFRKSPNFQK